MSLWQNFRDSSGLADPEWRRFVVRWSLVSLLLITVAAYFSYGFYQFDEHYQVVEFTSQKLGRTPRNQLPWEFRLEVRSWLQPGLYFVVAKGLESIGVENPFTLAVGFRAISGLLGWSAITALMFAAGSLAGSDQRRRVAVVLLALLWLLPYLAVRTSSESLSSDFLALGVVVLVLGSPAVGSSTSDKGAGGFTPVGAGQRLFPKAALLLAGLSFGLAFEFRCQIALAVIGVLAWVGWNTSERWLRTIGKLTLLCMAAAVPVALGTLVDRWGYGHWTCVPWNYFVTDILHARPTLDGSAPFWRYFISVNSTPLAPITIFWTIGALVTWTRSPRHIVTWATLPFVVFHCLFPHKEVRYLFPLATLGVFFFVLAFVPGEESPPQPAWLQRIWHGRRFLGAKLIYALNLLALAYGCLWTREPSLNLQRYIYNHYPHGTTVYVVGKETRSPYENVGATMFFYRPPNLDVERLWSFKHLAELLPTAPEHFLLVRDRLDDSPEQDVVVPQAQLIYSTYPTWIERVNYFDWLRYSKRFGLYAVDIAGRPTTAAGQRPHAERRPDAGAIAGVASGRR